MMQVWLGPGGVETSHGFSKGQAWQKTERNHVQEGESVMMVAHLDLETQLNRMI
jgi:hypothetical protein